MGIIALAWAAAYALRFHTDLLPQPEPHVPDHYLLAGLGMLPVWHILLRQYDLYAPRRGLSRWSETRKLIEVCTLGTLIVVAVSYFARWAQISRLVLGLFWVLSSASLVVFRAGVRSALSELRKRGYNQRRVLIVGTGTLARTVYERFRDDPGTGFHVVGFLGPSAAGLGNGTPPNLGSLAQLHEVVSTRNIDQVVIALDRGDPADPMKLLHELRDTTAAVRLAPDLLGIQTLQAGIDDLDGLPLLRLVESPLVGWSQILKRAFDFSAASVGLILASPLLGAIALAVKFSSRGPLLYRQERMGLDGRLFSMLKFRTMVPDAEAHTGPRWAVPDDPRRTEIGAFLRTFSLDELPQLWNVVRGEMSLVGPRPERPEFIREFRKQIPGYMLRHKMKAGVTGWAQVNGCRGNTSIEKRLEYDIDYARRWSLWFDLKIIALTFLRLRDPNAY